MASRAGANALAARLLDRDRPAIHQIALDVVSVSLFYNFVAFLQYNTVPKLIRSALIIGQDIRNASAQRLK